MAAWFLLFFLIVDYVRMQVIYQNQDSVASEVDLLSRIWQCQWRYDASFASRLDYSANMNVCVSYYLKIEVRRDNSIRFN